MLRRHSSGYDFLFFLTILTTLLSLATALAHLFELPRKMLLDQGAYFTVQIGQYPVVIVRGKAQAAEVVKTPFVPHRYVRKL